MKRMSSGKSAATGINTSQILDRQESGSFYESQLVVRPQSQLTGAKDEYPK